VLLRPNAATAYAYLEARVWPNGPVCPKCGGIDRTGKMKGKSTRIGVLPVPQAVPGTVVTDSKRAMCRCGCGSRRRSDGFEQERHSSNQLHRTLGVTIKTAWFMSHRIREPCALLALSRWAALAKSLRSTIAKMDATR
jgi:hypothetical protein